MEKNIFKAFQPDIMERLGEAYCQNSEYKKSLKREEELSGQLEESLNSGQAVLMKEYYASISATVGICELLAYRQGMRDMTDILYGK